MRILAYIGVLAIIVAAGGAVFFFGGFFNVAASEPQPSIVNWALVNVRMASVERHARETTTVNLDDPQIVRSGARAFAARGCINCHGAPGVNWQKFSEGLQPDPPDLKDIVKEREPAELFWVIKNGIKMTAMPSFGAIGVADNEIWTIVAFVKKLPNVSEADFKAWTANP
jgi:mono/diheme cytochrome c family protein